MRELETRRDVVDASADDPMIVWVAQGMRPGVRAWAYRTAVAVAAPNLFRRNRLVVSGPAEAASALVVHALAEVGPTHRLFGAAELVDAVVERTDGIEASGRCGWMDATHLTLSASTSVSSAAGTWSAPGDGAGPLPIWLAPSDDLDVRTLLDRAFPESYAQPGQSGVTRWAGLRDASDGRLLATGADAWSVPGVGFVSGVATVADARRRGHAASLCRFLLGGLAAEYGRVGLMVDDWNAAAIRLYERLGLRWRNVASARAANQPASVPVRPSG